MGALTNPLMDEINGLSPGAKAALMQAHQSATAAPNPLIAAQGPQAQTAQMTAKQPKPPPLTMQAPSAAPSVPALGAPKPEVKAPLGTVTGDLAQRGQLLNAPHGTDSIKNPLLRGVAKVADAINPFVAIPGSTAQRNFQIKQNEGHLAQDEKSEQDQAQTANLQSMPELHKAQEELAQNKLDETQRQHDEQLREHGYKMDETGKIVPLEYGEMSPQQQAVNDLKSSQEELANARADLVKAQKANIPVQVQMAEQRIATAQHNSEIAAGRLGLSREALGFHEQEAQEKLDNPAIPQVAQGRAYQGEAILESAKDLKGFIDQNPEVFGNLDSYWKQYTNNTPISNPAAAKAMAKIASFAALQPALHGMRSHQAMQEFEHMIGGIPKNPESLKAAIDGLTESAAQPMVDVGTRHPHGAPAQGGTNDPLGIR